MTDAGCSPAPMIPHLSSASDLDVVPPRAKRIDKALVAHGHTRNDPYYWLRDDDRKAPEMLAYLEAENAYVAAVMAPAKPLRDALFEELKERVDKDDQSPPARLGSYWYYTRFEGEQQYPVYARRTGTPDGPEQVTLDVNALAKGHDFIEVVGVRISDDEQLLVWGEDTLSRRLYTLRFKDLKTGELLPDRIEQTAGHTWAGDNRTVFYVRKHPKTLRPHQVWRHELGTDATADVLVHEEKDESFYVGVSRTRSRAHVTIELESTLVSEVLTIPAKAPATPPTPVIPRQPEHEYSVTHHGGTFYVLSNKGARNFRLVGVPEGAGTDESRWTEVIPHSDDVLLESVAAFEDHLVIIERTGGLRQLRVRRLSDGDEHHVTFEDAAYYVDTEQNLAFDTADVRFEYSSPVRPDGVWRYDMNTRERTLLKEDKVLGGFDPANYETERLWVTARDGQRVPVSIAYRKGFTKDGSHPLYQYGYGSYGFTIDPWFDGRRISLLDRGFVVAIAHIRGGQALGRRWYDDGKMLAKKNTFSDFVDVTKHLIAAGYTSADRVVAEGGSAGGLLMGAVVNMAPDLYAAVHAAVPFVDVVTTMLDESIPLTTNEYDEWGNPSDEASYRYILSYSPYDNVAAIDYPHILVTTGLHDSQVQYWEPAKWVARLRARKTDDRLLLFDTDLSSGHGGASGRFKRYERTALVYAFFLSVLKPLLPKPAAP